MLYPFTPLGFSELLTKLYALPDHDIKVEAGYLNDNLPAWVADTFALDTNQTAFLNAMDIRMIAYLSKECSFCLVNRLPIFLKKIPAPENRSGKWIEAENLIQLSCADGHFLASGYLTIKIVQS